MRGEYFGQGLPSCNVQSRRHLCSWRHLVLSPAILEGRKPSWEMKALSLMMMSPMSQIEGQVYQEGTNKRGNQDSENYKGMYRCQLLFFSSWLCSFHCDPLGSFRPWNIKTWMTCRYYLFCSLAQYTFSVCLFCVGLRSQLSLIGEYSKFQMEDSGTSALIEVYIDAAETQKAIILRFKSLGNSQWE